MGFSLLLKTKPTILVIYWTVTNRIRYLFVIYMWIQWKLYRKKCPRLSPTSFPSITGTVPQIENRWSRVISYIYDSFFLFKNRFLKKKCLFFFVIYLSVFGIQNIKCKRKTLFLFTMSVYSFWDRESVCVCVFVWKFIRSMDGGVEI